VNLNEQIEKAFKAGVDWSIKYAVENGDFPSDIIINKELIHYINKKAYTAYTPVLSNGDSADG
jgi:hypothetical protein